MKQTMAQRARKKSYRVRYDRIIFVLAILVVMILILTSCISSCSKKGSGTEQPSVEDDMSSTDTTLSNSADAENGQNAGVAATEAQTITYSTISMDSDEIHTGNLILVNAENPCTFDTDAIASGTSMDVNLVTIKSILDTKSTKHYTSSDWEVGLDKEAATAMDEWLEDFYTATGNTDLRMIGGYRSDSDDLDFRTGRTLTLGIFPETGSSNFYTADGTYAWIAENAANYGFIQRYPDDKTEYFDDTVTERKSATFRYVGVAAATYISENNLCLEEYLETVKSYSIDSMLEITNGTTRYGVYYVPVNANGSTSFSVPADNTKYEISGNNMDGFVITVTLSGNATGDTVEPATTEASTEAASVAAE
jgi:D-alanyl-D-alanine carboxypeptidase